MRFRGELQQLGVDGWTLRAERVSRAGIAATLAHVELAASPQPHRRLSDIAGDHRRDHRCRTPIVERRCAHLPAARRKPRRASTASGIDAIEFHEVGALDAIVDIVGAVVGLRLLGVEELYCSPLPAGGGTARSMHGALPVPAPATLELMAAAGAPMAASTGDRPMEMVTPTGAAIVTTLANVRAARDARSQRVGYGAGGRDPEGWPNVLRIWLGDARGSSASVDAADRDEHRRHEPGDARLRAGAAVRRGRG